MDLDSSRSDREIILTAWVLLIRVEAHNQIRSDILSGAQAVTLTLPYYCSMCHTVAVKRGKFLGLIRPGSVAEVFTPEKGDKSQSLFRGEVIQATYLLQSWELLTNPRVSISTRFLTSMFGWDWPLNEPEHRTQQAVRAKLKEKFFLDSNHH